jgi:hypothetical protein
MIANGASRASILMVVLVAGCQTLPPTATLPLPSPTSPTPLTPPPAIVSPQTVIPQPLPSAAEPPLTSQPLPATPNSTSKPVLATLPPQPQINSRDGRNIPAVTHLIALGRQQIAAHQFDDAEQSLTQAQRLAPNNPAVYAYLSNIALQQQQGKRAEAMARHGLMLTHHPPQQKAFWQLIELAMQQQRNGSTAADTPHERAKSP